MLILGIIALIVGSFIASWGICTYLDNDETPRTNYVILLGVFAIFSSMYCVIYHFESEEEKRVAEYCKISHKISRW